MQLTAPVAPSSQTNVGPQIVIGALNSTLPARSLIIPAIPGRAPEGKLSDSE